MWWDIGLISSGSLLPASWAQRKHHTFCHPLWLILPYIYTYRALYCYEVPERCQIVIYIIYK